MLNDNMRLSSSNSSAFSEGRLPDWLDSDSSQLGSLVQKIFQVTMDQQSMPISNVAISSTKAASNSYSLFGSIFKTPSEVSEEAQGAYVLGVAASCLTVFDGTISAFKAKTTQTSAYRAGDKRGVLEGNVLLTRAGLQTMRGITYAIGRPLSHAAAIADITVGPAANSLIGRVAFGMSVASGVLSVVYFAFKALSHGLKIYERKRFFSKIELHENKIEYIKGRLGIEIEETTGYKNFREFSEEDQIRFLIKEGMKRIKISGNNLKEIQEIRKATGEFSEETLQALFKSLCRNLPPGTQSQQIIDLYKTIVREKKTYKMERILGKDIVKVLKTGITSETSETEIITKLKSSLKKNNKDDGWRLALFITIAVAYIATLALTGPVGAAIISGLFILTGLAVLALDGYDFYKDLKSGKTAKYDSLVSKIGFGIGVASIITGIIVMCLLGFNPISLGMLVVVGLLWLTVHGTMIYVSNKNSKKEEKKEQAVVIPKFDVESLGETRKIWQSYLLDYA